MIVSHEHRFIFIKTHKTAGTSVEVALSGLAGDDAIVTPVHPPEPGHQARNWQGRRRDTLTWVRNHPRGVRRSAELVARWRLNGTDHTWTRDHHNHMPAWLVRAKVGKRVWDSYFKFCFERNPWDKVVSLYWWRTRDLGDARPPFEEWLRGIEGVSDWPLYTLDGELAVDAVGRFEHLDEDLASLLASHGVPVDGLAVPRAKSGLRRSPVVHTDETDAHVRRLYGREIEAFGYSCPRELVAAGA
jgi:hypothetical protein